MKTSKAINLMGLTVLQFAATSMFSMHLLLTALSQKIVEKSTRRLFVRHNDLRASACKNRESQVK
jgi:hypothetical protein